MCLCLSFSTHLLQLLAAPAVLGVRRVRVSSAQNRRLEAALELLRRS